MGRGVVDALVRGLERRHAEAARERAATEGDDAASGIMGKCVGVKLENGEVVHAREAVISNAPIW